MKVVIDIPEEHYRTLQEAMKNHMESLVGKIILNGTVLPKHGVTESKADMNEVFDEYGNYIYPTDVVLDEPNTVMGFFRYPTKEEADSVNRYINSISSQTSVNFWDYVTKAK